MIAAALSNPLDCGERRDSREKEYLRIVKKYNKEQQVIITKIFTSIIMALEENPNQDLLGDLYMALNLGVEEQGQFFTPYHISEFMAKITIDSDNTKKFIEENGYISMNEPCCGSGAMIVAFVNALRGEGINYQTDAFIVAQDISYTATLMCYIQMSLHGCAGVVICGNSLTQPPVESQIFLEVNKNAWFTPMYQSKLWRARREAKLLSEMVGFAGEKSSSDTVSNTPNNNFEPIQLSIFNDNQ